MLQNPAILARLAITGLFILLPTSAVVAQTKIPESQPEIATLTRGVVVEKPMTTGESHGLKVRLNAGEYVRVVIEQTGINIIVLVLDPGGAKIVEIDSPAGAYGPEFISIVAEQPGDYLLQLGTAPGRSNTGRYSAKIETLRNATPEDKANAAAEKTFALGRQLLAQSESRTEPDPKLRREEALKKFEQVRVYWSRAKSVRWEALALHSLAITHRRMSHLKEAAKYFHEALERAPQFEPRDWRLTATLLNDSGLNYADLGEHSLAIDSLTRALKMFQEKQDRRGEGSALINIGVRLYRANRFREGLTYFQKALPLRIEEKDQAGEANVLSSIAAGYDNLGEPHRALEYFNRSIDIFNKMTESEQARTGTRFAGVLNNRALVYHTFGQWKEAIESYQQALKIFQKLEPANAVKTQNNLGKLYYDLGDPAKALNELSVALERSLEIGDPTTTAEVLLNLGEVKTSQGETSVALTYFMRARDVGPADHVQAAVLTKIGGIKLLQGDPRSAIDYVNEALKLYRKIESVEGEGTALQRRGEAHLMLGEKVAALEDFKLALRHANSIAAPQAKINALHGLARVERELKDLNAALVHSTEALELIESQRTKVPGHQLRTSYFSTQLGHYELFIDLMMHQYRTTRSESYLIGALEASESARARDLLLLLTGARVDLRKGIDPGLLKQQDEIQQKLNAKAEAHAQMRQLTGKQIEEEARTIEKEITILLDEYDAVKTKIKAVIPAYAKLTEPKPLALSEIQRLLDDDTLLLQYFLGDEKSYLWLVSRTSVTGIDSLPKRSDVEKSATAFYEAVANRTSTLNDTPTRGGRRKRQAVSVPVDPAALSQILLGPVADKIGNKRLLIVGDGVLHYLPFGALPSPVSSSSRPSGAVQSARVPYLIEEHEIVYLPSASVLSIVRSEADRKPEPLSVAVIANPVFTSDDGRLQKAKETATAKKDPTPNLIAGRTVRSGLLVPLPATEREANEIKNAVASRGRTNIWKDFDASRARVFELQKEKHHIIHFATHGDLNTEYPELSSIVLSFFDAEGRQQEGFLRLHDIYNLKLPADLIVLSACSTGLGQVIKGEGLIGLTRGFMHAGSPRVVASLWRIEDDGTSELMKRFYQQLVKEGMAPASALRQAQIEMVRHKRLNSPYYWAGFVLQGEWSAIR